MFDIGWSEILIVMVVVLVVMGPRELPEMLHHIGRWLGRARGLAGELQRHVDEIVRTAELDEAKKQAHQISTISPERLVREVIDPGGELQQAIDDVSWDRSHLNPGAQPPGTPAGLLDPFSTARHELHRGTAPKIAEASPAAGTSLAQEHHQRERPS